MLKLGGARLLDERDADTVRAALADAPVASCMVAARLENAGFDPWRLGGELWGCGEHRLPGIGRLATLGSTGRTARGELDGLCFSGPNLVPLIGNPSTWRMFAERALRKRRMCSSLVGPADQVLGMWSELAGHWGMPREVRDDQPLLAMSTSPAVRPDPLVRRVRPDELDRYLPAAIRMFVEEVGIDPAADDGGSAYRARVAELIAAGRAFARFDGPDVVFKAEIGALSASVGQIQGVWVRPDRRGEGLAARGTAAVVDELVNRLGRTASLYVNAYNIPANAAYRRVGFRQVGQYATVLF